MDGEIASLPHLAAIRDYNRMMLGELAKCFPLANSSLLDLGASVHGFALEAALLQGVKSYAGIDWGITRHWGADEVEVTNEAGVCLGRLQHMDAEHLRFPAESFDVLLSISTFEHFFQPAAVLAEMHRVLRPGGVALVSFEPIWTSARGHHLHHFGNAVSALVPPWSHLFLNEEQMHELLARKIWPTSAPVDLDRVLHWIYRGDGVNRIPLRNLRECFFASPFRVEWVCDLADPAKEVVGLSEYVGALTGIPVEDLKVRGLSLFLRKAAKGTAPLTA